MHSGTGNLRNVPTPPRAVRVSACGWLTRFGSALLAAGAILGVNLGSGPWVIFVVAGTALVGWIWWRVEQMIQGQLQLARDGMATTATVTLVKTNSQAAEPYSYFDYEYWPDQGRESVRKILQHGQSKPAVGDTFPIIFDPRRPHVHARVGRLRMVTVDLSAASVRRA